MKIYAVLECQRYGARVVGESLYNAEHEAGMWAEKDFEESKLYIIEARDSLEALELKGQIYAIKDCKLHRVHK